MKTTRAIVSSIFAVSVLINVIVGLAAGFWLSSRLRPLPVKPPYMKEVIKELSWNSAGRWRVVEHDREAIIVEYRLPIYDISRYKLSKQDFKLSGELEAKNGSFGLSFDACDIYAKSEKNGDFECMKFRDLSPPGDSCNGRTAQ